MSAYPTRGLAEARHGEAMPDHGYGSPGYEAEILLRVGTAYRLSEVMERIGVSRRQVQALIDDGSLVAVNVGRGHERRDLRVLEDDLAGFLRRRSTATPNVPPVDKPKTFERPKPTGTNPSFVDRLEARIARMGGR